MRHLHRARGGLAPREVADHANARVVVDGDAVADHVAERIDCMAVDREAAQVWEQFGFAPVLLVINAKLEEVKRSLRREQQGGGAPGILHKGPYVAIEEGHRGSLSR